MFLTPEHKAFLRKIRAALDKHIVNIAEDTVEINEYSQIIRKWKQGIYNIGDVRLWDSIPYKCVQAHDSTNNEDWNPTVASLWMQYHGTSKETARAWVAPTGAQDMYKVGEWMIWTDGTYYECLSDTNFSPVDYAAAWRADI